MRNESHLNYLRRKTADEAELWAADRIEELERAVEFQKKAWTADLAENDALQADNARLRKAINRQPYTMDREVCEALAATPEQSLARIRNQVRSECEAVVCRELFDSTLRRNLIEKVRAMKEQE